MRKFFIFIFFIPGLLLNYLNLKLRGVKFSSSIQIRGFVFVRNRGRISIGKQVRINSSKNPNPIGGGVRTNIVTLKNGEVIIGDFTKMTNCSITSAKKIIIGNHVFIGDGVGIFDTDFHSLNPSYRKNQSQNIDKIKVSAIEIGDYAFIGTRSLILKGVKIGEGAVIGAGSVVRTNVGKYEVWTGNPAIFIRNLK